MRSASSSSLGTGVGANNTSHSGANLSPITSRRQPGALHLSPSSSRRESENPSLPRRSFSLSSRPTHHQGPPNSDSISETRSRLGSTGYSREQRRDSHLSPSMAADGEGASPPHTRLGGGRTSGPRLSVSLHGRPSRQMASSIPEAEEDAPEPHLDTGGAGVAAGAAVATARQGLRAGPSSASRAASHSLVGARMLFGR